LPELRFYVSLLRAASDLYTCTGLARQMRFDIFIFWPERQSVFATSEKCFTSETTDGRLLRRGRYEFLRPISEEGRA
jgi:hypothetical protein